LAPSARGRTRNGVRGRGPGRAAIRQPACEMTSVVAERRWMSVRRNTLRKRTWQFRETWEMTVELILRSEVSESAEMDAVRLVFARYPISSKQSPERSVRISFCFFLTETLPLTMM